MKHKHTLHKHRSILIKIFAVIIALTGSIIMFILAFWGVMIDQPNPRYAHIHLFFTLIILIIVGSVVASFVIRKILKPLKQLNEAVKKVGEGHLDLNLTPRSNDELGELTTAFNHMTADLKKMIHAREQLLLDVSHELRSPITRAKIALEMMPESPGKESVWDDLKEMEIMITEILESERLKSGITKLHLAPVNVSALLGRIVENYKRESSIVVLLPVSKDIIIQMDEALMTIVLRNLIDNALKYSSPGNQPIEISVIRNAESVTIQIEDFGNGIPEEKLPFVFDPFYRVDESRSRKTGGYGLGLHLCKRIMDLHGAEIGLRNKVEGKGLETLLLFKL
ncbi:MAG TPA: HAMP domain-containing sensor histidine kinase [Bacteroidales bacterium]|nr:HAMP domain-containing sensor histidine kinase [Bacteroidales bacterium]